MRTALIAAVKRTEDGVLRAELRMAGRSVLEWQVDLVRALGCDRILCLCDAPSEGILALQRQTESDGGEFHAIRNNLQIASIVRADDELVMLRDGLLVDRKLVSIFCNDGSDLQKEIMTISASHQLADDFPEDFERIDRERHWAGFAVMRAGQVHKLADLPPDSDAMSLLLRLGLQARVECRALTAEELDGGQWLLATGEDALAARELALIGAGSDTPVWTGPFQALASKATVAVAPRWLNTGPQASGLGAIALLLTGVALAAAGYGIAGLAVLGIGAFAGSVSGIWSRLRSVLWSEKKRSPFRSYLPAAIDIAVIAGLILALGPPSQPLAFAALPILSVGLARFAGKGSGQFAPAFWRDRVLHIAIFAIALAGGWLSETIAVFGLGALLQLMLHRRG